MNTIFLINSNIDTHNEYTKTRVADQSGNFIVHTNMTNSDEVITPTETPDPALKNFEPILYSADNKFGENSLHFDGSHYCYLNDRFHVFNFAQRSFSIEAWVKFDQSAGNKVHTIMSKWTNDIASLDNRIFRFLYRHDGNSPEDSELIFEFNGMKGYPTENFNVIYVKGYEDGKYDGEYNFMPNVGDKQGLRLWKGENGILATHQYHDPEKWAEPKSISKFDMINSGNLIKNSDLLTAWDETVENSGWGLPRPDDFIPISTPTESIPEAIPTETVTSAVRDDHYLRWTSPMSIFIGDSSSYVNYVPISLDKKIKYLLSFIYEETTDDKRPISVKIVKNPTFQHGSYINVSYDEVEFEGTDVTSGVNNFEFVCSETAEYGVMISCDTSYDGNSPRAQISSLSLRLTERMPFGSPKSVGSFRLIKTFTKSKLELTKPEKLKWNPPIPTSTETSSPTNTSEPIFSITETTTATGVFDGYEDYILTYVDVEYSDPTSSIDMTDYVYTGTTITRKSGDLTDGNWHHVYVSLDGDMILADREVCMLRSGVDGEYEEQRIRQREFNTITYTGQQLLDGTNPRVEALSAIQPYFQHSNNNAYYQKMRIQKLIVGASDEISSVNNFNGFMDSIRVNEYSTYRDAQELRDYYNSNSPFSVVKYVNSISNVAMYDEKTEYEFDIPEEPSPYEIFPVTHVLEEGDVPYTALEMYKQMIGSFEYLKMIWNEDTEPTLEDLDRWRWELKFVSPPSFLNRTSKEIGNFQTYVDEELKRWSAGDTSEGSPYHHYPTETITPTLITEDTNG